jgi:hypothetical protein
MNYETIGQISQHDNMTIWQLIYELFSEEAYSMENGKWEIESGKWEIENAFLEVGKLGEWWIIFWRKDNKSCAATSHWLISISAHWLIMNYLASPGGKAESLL